MFTPVCIKCREKYDSPEPDDYYCANCLAEKNAIAQVVDEKLKGRPRKVIETDLQRYDRLNKGGFVKIQDMGITL